METMECALNRVTERNKGTRKGMPLPYDEVPQIRSSMGGGIPLRVPWPLINHNVFTVSARRAGIRHSCA